MSVKVCNVHGCPELTEHRSARCDEHRHDKMRERRGSKTHYTADKRWQRVRREVLDARPRCERGCGRPSEVVHHVDDQGLKGPRAYDPSNLEALCAPCHNSETAKQHGFGSR